MELAIYSKNDISTNVDALSENQKELIAHAMGKSWTVPEFKVRYFIGNAQITPYAKLKQYMTELNTRESAVENMEYEIEKLKCELEIEHAKKEATADPIAKKIHDLEILKLDRMYKKSKFRMRDAYAERAMFLKLIEEFNNSPEGRLPDGTLLMDAIDDPVLSEQLERDHWTLRLAKQTAMDMIAYGRAGVGNMEAVYMLDGAQQQDVMALACDLFVRNETRTNGILSMVNESIQNGQLTHTPLTQVLDFKTPKENPNVSLIQNSQ